MFVLYQLFDTWSSYFVEEVVFYMSSSDIEMFKKSNIIKLNDSERQSTL